MFLAENRITVAGHFSAVHITPDSENDGGNDDAWRITINTGDNGGQPLEFAGREGAFVSFVVTGGQEMAEIIGHLGDAWDQVNGGPAAFAPAAR